MSKYDFIGIGDIVTDAFIQLKEATVEDGREMKRICLRFGDKIPYEDVTVVPAVGNSANASVSARRLGLKSALLTNLGNDYYGQECLGQLKKEKVSREFVKVHKGKATNYHYVLLFKGERTILIKHHEYDYVLPNLGRPRWIYLSSLGEHSLLLHSALEKYLALHPEIKLAFQPGTYQIRFGKDALTGIYKRADLFFCNREEAQRILGVESRVNSGFNNSDIKELLKNLAELGPKIVVITDGTKGAYVYDRNDMWFMPMYPDPKPPLDRTGAGDAFSSAFTAALALGMDIPRALSWGPVNSMSVVQQIGARAGLLTRTEIEKYLAQAPADYKPQLL